MANYDRPAMLHILKESGFVYNESSGRWERARDGARLEETALAGVLHQAVQQAEAFVYAALREGFNPAFRVKHTKKGKCKIILTRQPKGPEE